MDNIVKGNSLSKNKFLEKKIFLQTEYNNNNNNNNNNIKTFNNLIDKDKEKNKDKDKDKEKDINNIRSKTIYNNGNSKILEENNFYFDKNNKQVIRYPKNFFKQDTEKKSRTKVSLNAPEWFKVVTDEKNKQYNDLICKNEETLSIFSRYNKWITVTPKSKNRRKPLEKMKIEKMDETSKIMPNWMQIRSKKDMELYGKMKSAQYNSIRHVINFLFFLFYFIFLYLILIFRVKIL